MGSNILITGAAGYIGGSVVADFLASNSTLIKKEQITAAVRSAEQANALSKSGINVLQLDLTDEKAVVDSVLRHNIGIAINTASSIDPRPALHLIAALSKQREVSGQQTYFIHTSGMSAFFESTAWPQNETKDTRAVFDREKQLADSFPIRKTDVAVIEHAKARGVTSFIVVPPLVYGKGSGEWNKLSVVLPVLVQAFISRKKVYRFAENTKASGVHISDLTALYGLLVEKILQKETPPSGVDGYYFALAHDYIQPEFLEHLAVALQARGLVTDPTPQLWPSDEFAAESLGIPLQFVQLMWNSGYVLPPPPLRIERLVPSSKAHLTKYSSDTIVSENPYRLGWKPAWSKDRFLQNVDDEIEAVLQLGKAKSSLVDSLFDVATEQVQ
ncbi:MAG: hypothetical protein M1819_004263 [Sarea resinae]|nr:MAG: hypothetical protein M1819_004263 [Sarea resinae]